MINSYDQRAWDWTCPACEEPNSYVCEPEDAAGAVEHGVDDALKACGVTA